MRLILLTCLTMIAFASNSVLNRMAVDGGGIDPSSFAMIRVLAGAVALCMILTVRGGGLPMLHRDRIVGAFSLAAYMIGFSLAYVTLDAGLGALILFGTVQVTMFGWTALRGGHSTVRQLTGASIAFTGLLIALWPDDTSGGDIVGAALMVVAGLGWAAYTLVGKRATDPLAATAANFVWTLPLLALLLFGTNLHAAPSGIALAILSGAVTSGLGYALWYSILPRLTPQTAAVLQLSVPLIAIAAGALLLGEALSFTLALASALVVGGIAVAVTASRAQAGHS
ncbi:DMT family transporter [Tateyamaria sp. syn59]|uniref:DMT family transporter n=1 Tax=Tateyamaria sp. syn59 TaxID=2576942 RepID=UPI0011BF643A|nr:DMT family transporter [Tateyamaria sp. syn59]